jgi:hypothetical protein
VRFYFSSLNGTREVEALDHPRFQFGMPSTRYWNPRAQPKLMDKTHLIVDSGAFTIMMARRFDLKTIDAYIDAYLQKMSLIPDRHSIVELDIENAGVPMKVVDYAYNRLATESGKYVLRVWHPKRGIEGWKKMCEAIPYIGIARRDRIPTPDMARLLFYALDRGVAVHGFAFSSVEKLMALPFYSTDATSWTMPITAFGLIRHLDHLTLSEKKIMLFPGKAKTIDHIDLQYHNLASASGTQTVNRADNVLVMQKLADQMLMTEKMVTDIWTERGITFNFKPEELRGTDNRPV